MKDRADFFDQQYRAMQGSEAEALDHGLYRYLLPWARSRIDVACEMLGVQAFTKVVELGWVRLGRFFQLSKHRIGKIP